MSRIHLALLGLVLAGAPAVAQDPTAACSTPDSIAVRGNSRVSESSIVGDAGLSAGSTLNFRAVQTAIRNLFGTGQFSDVQLSCVVDPITSSATLIYTVTERPILGDVAVEGVRALSPRIVKEQVDLLIGRPIDPAQVARVVSRIDSLYEREGYYLSRVLPETTVVDDKTKLTFRIEEGRRLAVSGVFIEGNSKVSDAEIVGAMKTKPEGFWWFRRGELDDDAYAADVGQRIPQLYGQRGFVDFQILHDTLVIDRERGKAMVQLRVDEGERYEVGTFEVVGNRRFSTEEIARYFPFTRSAPTISQRLTGIVRRRPPASNVFDEKRWEDATQRIRTAYNNEGYIYASVRPVVDRQVLADSARVVNLRWEISEREPAIVNRIDIAGNDYTSEECIRSQLVVVPGDVFNQDRLIRSYQNIANLGFFETPLPFPDTRPANEEGDVDIVFSVKEKRTGSVNFGASVGQGTGLGGVIGLEQPNLFGLCKRGSLQWQFGSYINDFNLSYSDPAIQQSRVSGTVNAYRSQSRYRIGSLGRSTRVGGGVRIGLPAPRSPFTRFFLSYGGEAVSFGGDRDDLLRSVAQTCNNCFRSTLGLTAAHDTRVDLPFATQGTQQTLTAEFNGGPLGGTANFQRYTGEVRTYAPLGQFGGTKPGSQPVKFVLGLTARAGTVFGNTGPFFFSQRFALGGTQFGEQLRGYDEFSISPRGPLPGTDQYRAQVESFGSAFFSTTAEVGARISQMVYVHAFYDAGNLWNHPREFDPTRLYRGAGLGLATIIPALGPLGIDWAYGFDRVDAFGRPAPGWKLHFKLGQLF